MTEYCQQVTNCISHEQVLLLEIRVLVKVNHIKSDFIRRCLKFGHDLIDQDICYICHSIWVYMLKL